MMIYLIVFLAILSVVVVVFVKRGDFEEVDNTTTDNQTSDNSSNIIDNKPLSKDLFSIIVEPDTVYRFLENDSVSLYNKLELNASVGQNYSIYENANYLGDYNITYNDKWYIYDNNKNFVNYEGNIVVLKGDVKPNVLSFLETQQNDTDKNIITNYLNNLNISYNYDELYKIKYIVNQETFYVVSNSLLYERDYNYAFTFIFKYKNNKYYEIYKVLNEDTDTFNVCKPALINVFNYKKNYYIFKCDYHIGTGYQYMLFDDNNDKFSLVNTSPMQRFSNYRKVS